MFLSVKKEDGTCMCEKIKEEFVCVGVLRPIQPNGAMSNAVSLPDRTFTGQA